MHIMPWCLQLEYTPCHVFTFFPFIMLKWKKQQWVLLCLLCYCCICCIDTCHYNKEEIKSNQSWDNSTGYTQSSLLKLPIQTITATPCKLRGDVQHPKDKMCHIGVTKLWTITLQGWGLLSQFPPFRYFPNFSESQKHTLAIEYHVHIWQVSPQLSCGDTCQIWMWSKESNRYFCKIENFACGEISERSFSNPHTRNVACFNPLGWTMRITRNMLWQHPD